ncbi:MAG: TIGR00730 family Rossman fold protein [Wenzhouxiangella sp.]
MSIERVTVYAASSQALAPEYTNAASRLGRTLGEAGLTIVYGGGGRGLMGAMADAALAAGTEVYGIIPEFLTRVEAGHQQLTALEIVEDMRTRKARMLEDSDAVIALPGGCGTFEELFEAMTLKRLGQFLGPIVLVNTGGYYDRLLAFLQQSVDEHFMNRAHLQMWQSVAEPEQVLDALGKAPAWSAGALDKAAVLKPAS